jgi:hypothetical protein
MTLLDGATMRSYAKRFDAIRQLPPDMLIPEGDRWKHTIKDLKEGGFIRYGGRTYLVVQVGRYDEVKDDDTFSKKTGFKAFEHKLFCIDTGELANIEWEEDDKLEISITTGEVSFRELRDDGNEAIDEDDLDQIVEDEDSIFFRGREFAYDDDWASVYYTGKGRKGENVFMYEFVAEDGSGDCLTIEEWGSGSDKEEYQIFTSRLAGENEIEILCLGGGEGNA